jgi:thioredoxin 1
MSDNITHVTDGSFQIEVLQSDLPVLVDFWAEWCVPCHMVSPAVEEIARAHAERLKAVKVNVDDNPETARECRVMSVPTLIMFKGGQEVARVMGARGKEAILREFEPHILSEPRLETHVGLRSPSEDTESASREASPPA